MAGAAINAAAPDPFANDGCTGFIDGWGRLDWRYCCDLHDKHFAEGQDWGALLDANVRLFHCVATHDGFAAPLMSLAVMTVGCGSSGGGRGSLRAEGWVGIWELSAALLYWGRGGHGRSHSLRAFLAASSN
jgi:hypothetical protein